VEDFLRKQACEGFRLSVKGDGLVRIAAIAVATQGNITSESASHNSLVPKLREYVGGGEDVRGSVGNQTGAPNISRGEFLSENNLLNQIFD
jgi:hypothetical protein